MKIKTIIPRAVRKKVARLWRFAPLTELMRTSFKSKFIVLHSKSNSVVIPIDKNDILIDCGANVGDITSLMARTRGVIYAFEPDPNAFRVIKRRFKYVRNVQIFNKGVCPQSQVMPFFMHRTNGKDPVDASVGSSFFEEKNKKHEKINIECVDFPNFIEGLGRSVSLLKMDIEGMEFDVIDSLISSDQIKNIKKLIIETHERQMPTLHERKIALERYIHENDLKDVIDLDWK